MKRPNNTIPVALRVLMEERGVRQVDIVEHTGLSKSYVSMILNGSRTPEIEKLRTICSSLGISLSSFFLKVSQLEQEEVDNVDFKRAFEALAELDRLVYDGDDDNRESDIKPVVSPSVSLAVIS